jgi:hypothetical protein
MYVRIRVPEKRGFRDLIHARAETKQHTVNHRTPSIQVMRVWALRGIGGRSGGRRGVNKECKKSKNAH